MTPIDLTPLVDQVLVPIVSTVLVGVATWALTKVAAYAHFQISDGQRKVVADAITNGIAYAEKQLAGNGVIVSADAKVAAAVNYVLPKVPGALKALGVTPEHLAQIIAAKLPA
jgi:hypothetical protein